MTCENCGKAIYPGDAFSIIFDKKSKETYALCLDCADKKDDKEKENKNESET